jgi:hypothetical protein
METVSRRLDWEDIAKKTMMVYKNIIKDINTAQAGKHRMP